MNYRLTWLLDAVLKQMQKDFDAQDFTAIEDLLTHVPLKYLEGYLPEEQGGNRDEPTN